MKHIYLNLKVLTSIILLVFISLTAQAAWVLDNAFGTNGQATTRIFPNESYFNDEGNNVAVQADGKILVVGRAYNNATFIDDYAIVRYNTDGTVDNTFGTNGIVIIADATGAGAYGENITVQSDGKILVAGVIGSQSNGDVLSLIRFNADGSLDTSFGNNGHATGDVSTKSTSSILIQGDGSIIVGSERTMGSGNYDLQLVKYKSNGTRDSTFGTNGVVLTDINNTAYDYNKATVQQSNGKIVVIGSSKDGSTWKITAVRYNTDGSKDNTFGTNGIAQIAVGSGNSFGRSGAIVTGDKIVIVGKADVSGNLNEFTLIRLNADGSLDTSFGTNGIKGSGVGTQTHDNPWDLKVQADGKIVIAGTVQGTGFVVLRFNADGSADTSFGPNGKVDISKFDGGQDYGMALAIQADGKIVVAGSASIAPNSYFAFGVARIKEGAPTSVQSLIEENALSVYPNPSTGVLFVTNAEANSVYTITDLLGNIVQAGRLTIGTSKVTINNLPQAGVYLLNTSKETVKFVIK